MSPVYIPFHLWQQHLPLSTRIYSLYVLTSFVLPIHIIRCQLSSSSGSCPLEFIPADLLAHLFVFITDLRILSQHLFDGRFHYQSCFLHPFTMILLLLYRYFQLWSLVISLQHLCSIIRYSLCQYRIKDP